MTRRALTWTANAAATGVIGWVVLMVGFDVAWRVDCWRAKMKREGSC